jgi:hypothetical protein
MAAQAPAVGVADVIDPALNAGVELREADRAGVIGGKPRAQPAVSGAHLACLDAAVGRVDDEAEPGNAGGHGQHLRPALVNDEAQGRQPLDNCRLPRPQLGLLVAEQREVVDVAEVGAAAEHARHELIERMQITVGPEL